MLDGKCKEAFENWYKWTYLHPLLENSSEMTLQLAMSNFYDKRFAEQWGVYLEFFDSVGIIISIDFTLVTVIFDRSTKDKSKWHEVYVGEYSLRSEAQAEAITKANEIFNLA